PLFRILLGFMPPSAGEARILGKDSQSLTPADRSRIGFVNEEHTLPNWMRVAQVTAMQERQYPRWNQQAFDGVIGHYHVLPEQKVGQLSRGERAGFNLALALAQGPELLVLDEPTLGLDVVAKRAFLESLLYSNAARDCTVIYCSHQMEEVERVADNLVILECGRLVNMSAPDDFRARVSHWVADIPFKGPDPRNVPGLLEQQRLDGLQHYIVLDQGEEFGDFRRAFHAQHAGEPGPRGQRLPGEEPRRTGQGGSAMKDLFKGELLRFRAVAIATVAIHLVALGFMSRLVDLAQQPKLVYQVIAMVYVVLGLLLGLYQMGSYRRANHWLNLLHRPLHRLRIAGALCGAGGVVLVVAIGLPILAIAGYQEAFTARVVDLRHWLLPLAAVLVAACGYLAGAYAALASRRYAVAAAMLPAAFLFSPAGGGAASAVQAIVLLVLAVLVGIAFRPQVEEPPRHPLAIAATALPVQVGVYF